MANVDYPRLIVGCKTKKCHFEVYNKPPAMLVINVQGVWSNFARF